MNEKNSENGIRVYYAHPIELYNTSEEKNALKVIQKCLPNSEIINPKKYDGDPKLSKQKKAQGMKFCFRLINKADCLVFQCFPISSNLKEFILDYLAHADEYKGQLSPLAKREMDIFRKLVQNRKITTPGVCKEIDYAFCCNKPVYEVLRKRLKQIAQKPSYALLPLSSYRSFSILLKSYRSKSTSLLFPPFWWKDLP